MTTPYPASTMLPASVSEADARLAAESLARTLGLALIGTMIDGDREPERCRFNIYDPPVGFPEGWWVALALPRFSPPMLRSSEVIVVSKWTGGARHIGSANDEG